VPLRRLSLHPLDTTTRRRWLPRSFSLTFEVEVTRQAFHRTALTYAIVNLKPIVPGRNCTAPSVSMHILSHLALLHTSLTRTGPTRTLSLCPRSLDVLVCSTRPVPRLANLRADELAELMCAVQRVGSVVERVYKADGLTIACQVRHPHPSSFF
jgi:bis(5'-adenosyl)-triphosphatase